MEDIKDIQTVYEPRGDLTLCLPAYQERVRSLLCASVAPETRRAYASRLKRFFTWCQDEGVSTVFPTSPEILAAYLASLADSGAATATVEQILAAIAAAHRVDGIPSPTDSLLVKKTLKGYRRKHGDAPRKKDAATVEVVRMLLAALEGDSTRNIRDAAILALGFAGAFRRSELSAHSLRMGFVTTAIRQGKTERSIMNQTGHRSVQTLREYFKREDAMEDNAARDLM